MESPSDLELRRRYDQQIRDWFGEVRPLRLEGAGRFYTPPPALPLRTVFVPPALSPSYQQPSELEPDLGDSGDILHWLGRSKRLVILGDPGSGKSTLLGWLAWRLCAGLTEPLPDWCNDLLPLPLILRDLKLSAVTDFDSLIGAFLQTPLIAGHPLLAQSMGAAIAHRIANQPEKLLFLIDGLDEVSDSSRQSVRAAMRDGFGRLRETRFVVTSRIVGYEEWLLEAHWSVASDEVGAGFPPESPDKRPGMLSASWAESLASIAGINVEATAFVKRVYVAPLDNDRIRFFAYHWFQYGDAGGSRGDAYMQKFLDGLMRDATALQLGRTLNLLVMAAQVFGIANTLPDGRAKLYEAITKAYLESIDQRYGLADSTYSLEEKKSWLAAVGYRMQLRTTAADLTPSEDRRDLLVREEEVVQWLTEAMADDGHLPDAGDAERFARGFVDAIARRSGLFIPRGEQLYAFAHLSLQEYFAALHLQRQVREFALADPDALNELLDKLSQLSENSRWRETLVTFFELPDWKPREVAKLCATVFGIELVKVPAMVLRSKETSAPENAGRVELLARLAFNARAPLPAPLREAARECAWCYIRSEREALGESKPYSSALAAMTSNQEGCDWVWERLQSESTGTLAALAQSRLDLRGARIRDFLPLAHFSGLAEINLSDTLIINLEPLSNFQNMTRLILSNTSVSEIPANVVWPALEEIDLSSTKVSNGSVLGKSKRLRILSLARCPIADLSWISTCVDMSDLNISGTRVADISCLTKLRSLTKLNMMSTSISTLTPLSGNSSLEVLSFSEVNSSDPLRSVDLPKLSTLLMIGESINEIPTISHLHSIRAVALFDTKVSDVSPLVQLHHLEALLLHGSPVSDLGPLANRPGLRIFGGPQSALEPGADTA